MCGIAGYFKNGTTGGEAAGRLATMARIQRHRGPDQQGFALFAGTASRFAPTADDAVFPGGDGVSGGFAHQRLSILDLSDAGRQPMSSPDGRYWLCFNGEIYNYIELRGELEAGGERFASSSDTEVLLRLLQREGVSCLSRCNGMWSFALWDRQERKLLLARDRFGVKPLYYTTAGSLFAFASEIKALLTLPEVGREPDERAVADYLVHGRVDGFDFTFFKQIQSLPAGSCATVTFDSGTPAITITRWWNLAAAVDAAAAETAGMAFADAATHLRELLTDAVKIRLRSDVPVGTCLSGGLDSSAVVCLAAPHLTPVNQNAFSACYADFERDESRWIKMVIKQTGIRPHAVYPQGEELRRDLQRLLHHQEQPFSSTSIYAQWRVFELAKAQGVTVTLDGQGADETLAGYDYFFPVYYAQLLKAGHGLRWAAACHARARRQHTPLWRECASTAGGFFDHRRMTRLAGRISPQYATGWVAPHLLKTARELRAPQPLPGGEYLNRRLGEVFAASGLPALLRYADRNAMAHGVESRMPFMDWRVAAFLLALPAAYKLRDGESKAVFREAMRGIIPDPIRQRQDKVGFETPETAWFRTVLQPELAVFMKKAASNSLPWLQPKPLRALWQSHSAGTFDASRPIWRAWCLHLWTEDITSAMQ